MKTRIILPLMMITGAVITLDVQVEFTPHLITGTADAAAAVFGANMDSDGDADVLSASLNNGKIAALLTPVSGLSNHTPLLWPLEDLSKGDMNTQIYTHALWRVKPGNEEIFITAWKQLADSFTNLENPPLWGTLIRSATEPNVFYSFGPWHSAEDVRHMRESEPAQAAMATVRELCEESTPGMYHAVIHIDAQKRQ